MAARRNGGEFLSVSTSPTSFSKTYVQAMGGQWGAKLLQYEKLCLLLSLSRDTSAFYEAFEEEIESATLFAVEKLGEVAVCLQRGQVDPALSVLCLTVRFVELNMVAVKRLLSQRDALLATGRFDRRDAFGRPLSRQHFEMKLRPRSLVALEALEDVWKSMIPHGAMAKRANSELMARCEAANVRAKAAKTSLRQRTVKKQIVDASSAYAEEAFGGAPERAIPLVKYTDRSGVFGLYCQFAQALLFAGSLYTISPTAIHYLHALGAHSAYASLLIGATPLASLVSTATCANFQRRCGYRRPMVIGSLICAAANVGYSLIPWLTSDSIGHNNEQRHFTAALGLALLARFALGLGSTEPVNRAYLATVPPETRVAAAAKYVSASALGQGFGPLVAAAFGAALPGTTHATEPFISRYTAAPFFFAVLFALHAVLVACFFKEPPPQLVKEEMPQEEKRFAARPLRAALGAVIVLEFVRELLLASTAQVCLDAFGWKSKHTGALLGLLCVCTIPCAALLEHFSESVDDRILLGSAVLFTLFGACIMLSWPLSASFRVALYVIASGVVFLGTAAMESAAMALVAVLSSADAGLRVTLLGVAGSTFGDIWIFGAMLAVSQESKDVPSLINIALWGPACILLTSAILLSREAFFANYSSSSSSSSNNSRESLLDSSKEEEAPSNNKDNDNDVRSSTGEITMIPDDDDDDHPQSPFT